MKTLEELSEIRERVKLKIALREGTAGVGLPDSKVRAHVMVCGGTGCTASGSVPLQARLEEEIGAQGLREEIEVVHTGCFGLCALGPIVIVFPEGTFYSRVTHDDVPEIVSEHLIHGRPVQHLMYHEGTEQSDGKYSLNDTNFYRAQKRVALRNCGYIDPENIDEYIARDGYLALEKILTGMTPDDVVTILVNSGLRGRGGAGFPTGTKWKFAKGYESDVKYVCCNADEGDPGAFMDRSILEGDPHVILEAMTIAGFTIGANQGYVYVRAEYPIAVKRLGIAIVQARKYGLLGKNIMGTGFDFDIDMRLGAGAFVCGEETALMASIEGKRGEPWPRPPFPAEKGLFNMPSVLNNVETFANVPQIILNGAAWFSSIGTKKSKGTKVFALGGKINNTGLVEVPMGTTLRTVIEEIGGGIPNGKKFKAAQTGGPSGGCIPAEHFDVPIDYDNLAEIGSMMGSGGMIVMDEDNCMVDIAKFYLEFTVDESCGKCPPCRIGTKRLYEMLDRITEGKAEESDLEKIDELCYHLRYTSLCGLGQTAPNPVLSTMRYFREEYLAHINEKRCPAGVCKGLMCFEILPDKCTGCTVCKKKCPTEAITGNLKEAHTINQQLCSKCGICIEKCKFSAIIRR